ncbi:hypothetical protein JMJ35_010676 [Cladonia borealis]|uniref:Uncharacterized protein n=1 Tax=Cladonia borealis TaxID=184061 RepID=A0AA39QSB2_9LECA|nr:hypothetical protein JMJ35_010676 [Cladonia borealis]
MNTGALHLEVASIDEEEDVNRAVELLQDHHVYDVARGQTMRCMLLSMSSEQHYFVAGLHPLVADGMSFQSILKGVQQLYIARDHDQAYKAHQFSYYSEKQHANLATGAFDGELEFWKAEMAVPPPPLPILTLSRASSRPASSVYENERALLRLAAFRVLLLRYSPAGNGEDVAVGIGDGNRTESEMMDVIGPFVNSLALRLPIQSSARFYQLLQNVRDKAFAALANSKVPFQVLLNELKVSRSTSHTPLFQTFINYRQGLHKTEHWGKDDDSLAVYSVEIAISKIVYDTLVVRKDLCGLVEVQTLAKSYERLVEAFTTDPDSPLNSPDLFTAAEIQEALRFSRGPSWRSQWPETVIQRIDQIAQSQPQEVAVRCRTTTSTYAEVLAHENAIAAALRVARVTIASPVAVLLEPSHAWVSSLLGIMRAGAVHLPLDLSLPWARLAAMVHDCQPNIVLVDKDSMQYVSKLERSDMQVVDISSIERQDEATAILASADDLAVILYTSGSSGAPKGIMLKHEGLRNWTEPLGQTFNLGREVILQQTSPTFDLSLIQVFTALCFGGSLCIISRQQRGDAEAISKMISDEGVTFTGATPSEYTTWLHYGKRNLHSCAVWKTAVCAGEPVPASLVGQFASLGRTDLTLYNVYGPTETSFTCTATQVCLSTSSGDIAAVRPLPDYSVFIPNVLDKPKDDVWDWKTMHRSGDLERWLDDGQLLVEGRIDTQVKLRGLRIDLAEIEHAILEVAHGELCEAVVSVRKSSLDQPEFIVAHIVWAQTDNNRRDLGVIQSRLSKRLPKYMCPAAFVSLNKMPTTTSGKLDRRLIADLPLPSVANRLGDGEE